MPSIFLSHTSVDKPFVEKLANRLNKLGVRVWFDKWDIKVGDSLTWKIEDGIRENEYLGIILSPEAMNSEWVKTELSSAWIKQMDLKKVFILPIYYRDCQIPLFLRDKKYADFRSNFENGIKELAPILNLKETKIISIENWRLFIGKQPDWKNFRDREFQQLVNNLTDLAIEYNWSTYIGGTSLPFSVSFNNGLFQNSAKYICVRLDGKSNAYLSTNKHEWNPNRLKASDFDTYIGNTVNDCCEYIWRTFEDYKIQFGNPTAKREHYDYKFLRGEKLDSAIRDFANKFKWYQE